MLHFFMRIAKKSIVSQKKSVLLFFSKDWYNSLAMKKYTSVVLSVLVLFSVITSLLHWVWSFNDSIRSYRSPLRENGLSPQAAPTAPQTNKVVMVLISGLGYEDSLALNLPALERLKQTGANAAIQSIPPTFAQTSWATLITGAPSETNDAPPFDRALDGLFPLEVDTILARAHEANLQTALLGNTAWRNLISRDQLDYTFFTNEQGPQADEVIFEAALPLIRDNKTGLILIHFSQVDFAAQYQTGTSGEAFRQAAGQIDIYLNEISSDIDLMNAVLLVFADHGHLATGGYGGNEPEVIRQPFVMVGKNIIPGSYSDIHQVDLAPTISALLGLPPPTAGHGRVLFEMLRLSEYNRAAVQLALAQQRFALAEIYPRAIGDVETRLPTILAEDLTQANMALENKNINGAYELAKLAQQEADLQIKSVRNGQIQREQFKRLPIAIAIVLIWFITMWRRRGIHTASIIVAAVVTITLYHTVFQLQGHSYSISSLTDFAELPVEIGRRTVASMLVGGGLLLIFLMLTNETDWLTLLGTAYGFSVLVTFIFVLPYFWGYWQNGLTASWHLPAIVPIFWQLTSALEAVIAAMLGLVLAWPIMILSLFVNLMRRRMNETRPRPEPDALPGLHL